MSRYEGIKIPPEISIVENHSGQGYVVYKDDQKMLDHALYWAGNSYWDSKKRESVPYTPQVYTYKNGTFKLTVEEAADKSWSQGGRLSFWNCSIKAPDGKEFLIGINSDALCSLIKNSDMHKGEVEQPVWLGKRKTNTVAYTELMEEFEQALQDEQTRTTKQSVKYEKGQVVGTITKKNLYCGIWYKYFDFIEPDWYHRATAPTILRVYSQPIPMHVFVDLSEHSGTWWVEWPDFLAKKPKRIVYDEFDYETADSVFAKYIAEPLPREPLDQMAQYDLENHRQNVIDHQLRSMQLGLDTNKTIKTNDIIKVWQSKYKAYAYGKPIKVELV